MSNTVTITLAGDSKPAEEAFRRVGDAGDRMSKRVKESGDSFERAGERADELDTKAMGFRDTLTGIQDTTKGVKQIASGNWGFESLLLLGAGIGDLGSGLYNFLIPSLKAAKTAMMGLNLTFLASPITWIILAVVALGAAFVIAWKHSETFRRTVTNAWNGVRNAARAVGQWFTGTLWPWIKGVSDRINNAFHAIPGKIRSAFSGLFRILTAPFRTAFNFIADAWNNTIGRLSWSVPGWVPGIGGNSIGVPNLPHFHAGGTVPGSPGQEVLAVLQGGERVSVSGTGAETVHVVVKIDRDVLVDAVTKGYRKRLGNA